MERYDLDGYRNDAVARAIAGDPTGGIDPNWLGIGGNGADHPEPRFEESNASASSKLFLLATIGFLIVGMMFW